MFRTKVKNTPPPPAPGIAEIIWYLSPTWRGSPFMSSTSGNLGIGRPLSSSVVVGRTMGLVEVKDDEKTTKGSKERVVESKRKLKIKDFMFHKECVAYCLILNPLLKLEFIEVYSRLAEGVRCYRLACTILHIGTFKICVLFFITEA